MKGLLIKDLYITRQGLKSLIFILVVWGIVFLPRGGTFIIPMFTMVGGGISSLNLFSYDRQNQWDTFLLSMPVKRNMAAMERYVFSVGMTLFSSIVAAAVVAAAQIIMHGSIGSDMMNEITLSWLSGIGISFLYLSFALPLTFWLGVEKARIIPAVLLGALFLGFLFLEKNGDNYIAPTEEMLFSVIVGSAIVSVITIVISAVISVRIYEKKEF